MKDFGSNRSAQKAHPAGEACRQEKSTAAVGMALECGGHILGGHDAPLATGCDVGIGSTAGRQARATS